MPVKPIITVPEYVLNLESPLPYPQHKESKKRGQDKSKKRSESLEKKGYERITASCDKESVRRAKSFGKKSNRSFSGVVCYVLHWCFCGEGALIFTKFHPFACDSEKYPKTLDSMH